MNEREVIEGWELDPEHAEAVFVQNPNVSVAIDENNRLVVRDDENYYPSGRYEVPLAVIDWLRSL